MPEHVTFEEAAGVCDGFYQGLACLKGGGVGEDTRLCLHGDAQRAVLARILDWLPSR